MAQHDYIISDASGGAFLADLNNALAAIASNNSGAAAPSVTYPYQIWPDTTAGLVRQRDGANSAWITIGTLGAVNWGLASLSSPVFTGTPVGPTADAGTNSKQLATTAFVTSYAMPVLGTSQASTSGTSINFTGIPSWVKRVTVMFNGVSTNGASNYLIQLGSGSVQSTGYSSYVVTGGAGASSVTAGFPIGSGSALNTWTGLFTFSLMTGSTYVFSMPCLNNNVSSIQSSGSGIVALSGALDRIRITTVNGTDAFDAGAINILYE